MAAYGENLMATHTTRAQPDRDHRNVAKAVVSDGLSERPDHR